MLNKNMDEVVKQWREVIDMYVEVGNTKKELGDTKGVMKVIDDMDVFTEDMLKKMAEMFKACIRQELCEKELKLL